MVDIKRKLQKMSESAKSAIVYTLSTVFSRGLAIITVPIFTRLMTTDQIGEVNLYKFMVFPDKCCYNALVDIGWLFSGNEGVSG